MAKPKRLPKEVLQNSSNIPEANLCEDGWVIVKKQTVRILIPPLPITQQPSTESSDQQPIQPQACSEKQINTKSPQKKETHEQLHSIPEKEKATALSNEKRKSVLAKLARHDIEYQDKTGMIRYKNNKRPFNLLGAVAVLTKKMRALNLEKKLQRAGGLRRWLASLGLNQFAKIFERKSIGKFQLVNMTMEKLKDMGAHAVGPRRKLMHAIDCLCQPHCFEAFRRIESSRMNWV
ncbi:uncharacterized protein LOC124922172 [Impatiens glandulifera]|uniref:uncharacterized protein LOC124922172 n=1 Tax=Impatiens glandulifera TaxID=253017 RepID=UPI001FB0AB70|nr:uncharacterized protein LOC124922172 [Impatiens glandulifera]XP_047318859.1 uncharacterized protein LOC124922172 [Impatiens glandulifera]XP_047318860.1 uncharacterized protein LOC124922172 [Impatiens glandulifera]